jgi:hypothetical protein
MKVNPDPRPRDFFYTLRRNPVDRLHGAALERLLSPHRNPLPEGEGIASEDSCCATPALQTARSNIPVERRCSLRSTLEHRKCRGWKSPTPLGLRECRAERRRLSDWLTVFAWCFFVAAAVGSLTTQGAVAPEQLPLDAVVPISTNGTFRLEIDLSGQCRFFRAHRIE